MLDLNELLDEETSFTIDDEEDNPHSGLNKITRQGRGPEPKNNDGREICWWCSSPTKKVPGGLPAEVWDVCIDKECGK
jgi:hypothetical protein